MSMDPEQLRSVIFSTLSEIDDVIPYSPEAEDLLFMTAAHESDLGTYLYQVRGPALGVFQMEPQTHDDILDSYVKYRKDLYNLVLKNTFEEDPEEMVYNLRYAIIMARIKYYRDKMAIPKRSSFEHGSEYVEALAEYAKRAYNTHKGKATVRDYVAAYNRYNDEEI